MKVIGYDAGERRRVIKAFQNTWEDDRFEPWYPLVESGMDRNDCEATILEAGLPLPVKSACTFCPNNTLSEWEDVRREEPEAFASAIAMSRKAAGAIESPDVVGLMRCNPHGKRQLHVWADGGYPGIAQRYDDEDATEAQPCECAL